jgi:hypothetical protein
MAFGDQWKNRKFPNGCRNCGQTEKKHVGLGLCQNCYRDAEIQAAAREGTLEAPTTEKLEEDDQLPDFYDEVVDVTEDDIFVSGERRPGTITSPVADQDGVTPPPKGFGSFFGKKKSTETPKTPFGKKTSEKAPKAPTRRVTTAETIEDVWAAIGGIAQRTGRHAPLGRYLQWQAPAAGEMLDQALAGSFVDRRFLQPAVKTRGRLDVLAAVVGPPAIILAIEQNPERASQLLPVLKSAIRSSLPTLLPAMKKAQAREEKVNKAVTELFGDDFPPGVDPVDVVLEQMFGGWIPPTPEPTYDDETTDYANA